MENKDHALEEQPDGSIIPVETTGSKSASVRGSMVIVSLGDTYADRCVVCGERGGWGLASKKGPEGCQEALNNGKVYCKTHLP